MKSDKIAHINALHNNMLPIIDRYTKGKEECSTPISNLNFFRREYNTEPYACLIEPSVVLVIQGKKQIVLGEKFYGYDNRHFLITSLDLPVGPHVVEASPENPCIGLSLKLDLAAITDLIAHNKLTPPCNCFIDAGLGIGTIEPLLLEPFKRLLDLLNEPDAVEILAPLIEREIYYRLLMSDRADHLWQIASIGSQANRISKAIDWLKLNYASPLRVDELAKYVQMSTSSFHHHFRKLTAMSPLQYQKYLRLNEAKRLMLNESLDAASAAFKVGYESPSQFGREYSRRFGTSPKRDIVQLRSQMDG